MATIKVLFDGWPLVREPNSPAARHLLTILTHLPEGTQAVVALPEEAPSWMQKDPDIFIEQAANSESERLRWEQQVLPKAAKKIKASILHTTSHLSPLFTDIPVISSPAGFDDVRGTGTGLAARLRQSMGKGGFARGGGILWPGDLPFTEEIGIVHIIPPVVHPDYTPVPIGEQEAPAIPDVEMPETYTLYHGPGNEKALRALLQSWTWAAGPIGEYYPLLLVGLIEEGKQKAESLINELKVTETVRILPAVEPKHLVALIQNCSAQFHPASLSPWGDPVRHALACGRPVVAWEDANSDALAGPAAFLVEKGNLRAFGAAMISVVVKENLYEQLSERAVKRAKNWEVERFKESLGEIFRKIAG